MLIYLIDKPNIDVEGEYKHRIVQQYVTRGKLRDNVQAREYKNSNGKRYNLFQKREMNVRQLDKKKETHNAYMCVWG